MAGQKKSNQIAVSYDKDADVLYLSEGKPRKTICQMLNDGIVVRRNPKTKEVVGFTIVDFISHFSKAKPQSIPIGARFSLLRPA